MMTLFVDIVVNIATVTVTIIEILMAVKVVVVAGEVVMVLLWR